MVEKIARAALQRAGEITDRPVMITIDGRSSTGKTTLAGELSAVLDDAPVVHMDDLYPGWNGLAAALPALTDDILIPLRGNEISTYEQYDWVEGDFTAELFVEPAPYVIVEGCGCSVGPAGQLSDVRVWLEADDELRRARGLVRDAGAFDEHWDTWAEQEESLFTGDETREHADLVFDTSHLLRESA